MLQRALGTACALRLAVEICDYLVNSIVGGGGGEKQEGTVNIRQVNSLFGICRQEQACKFFHLAH